MLRNFQNFRRLTLFIDVANTVIHVISLKEHYPDNVHDILFKHRNILLRMFFLWKTLTVLSFSSSYYNEVLHA